MYSLLITSCRRVCGYRHLVRFNFRDVFLSMLLTVLCVAAHAAEPLTVYKAVLMQSGTTYRERIGSADALAVYIKAAEAVARTAVEHAGEQPPAAGFIVIALRPGQRSNVWLDFDDPVSDAIRSDLIAKIRTVLPIRVKDGPVVFALKVGLWGGKELARTAINPPEWKAAQQKSLMPLETEEIVEKIWKD